MVNFVSSSKERIRRPRKDWANHRMGKVPGTRREIPCRSQGSCLVRVWLTNRKRRYGVQAAAIAGVVRREEARLVGGEIRSTRPSPKAISKRSSTGAGPERTLVDSRNA